MFRGDVSVSVMLRSLKASSQYPTSMYLSKETKKPTPVD